MDPETLTKTARSWGVKIEDVNARARALEGIEKAKGKLELEVEKLHGDYLRAKDVADKARITEKMAVLQGKINAVTKGPYMTVGGPMIHVGRRDLALRPKVPFVAMSPMTAYTAVLDDFYMLQHKVFDKIAAAGGELTEGTAKDMAKFGERLMIRAGQLGAIDVAARASPIPGLFYTIRGLLKRSRIMGKRTALSAAEAHLENAKVLLTKTIEDMTPALKKNLETYLASAPHGAKSSKGFLDRSHKILLREIALVARISIRVSDEEPEKIDSGE